MTARIDEQLFRMVTDAHRRLTVRCLGVSNKTNINSKEELKLWQI